MIIWIVILGIILIFPSINFIKKFSLVKKTKSFFKRIFDNQIGRKIEIFGIIASIIALIYSYRDSMESSAQAEASYHLATQTFHTLSTQNKLTEQGLKKTDSIANMTLRFLDSISKSSNSLVNNIDSVSEKIIFINKNLTDLSQNLYSINKFSENQLTNLSNINEVMHRLFTLTNKQDSIRRAEELKEPKIIVYISCNFETNIFKVCLKNIGQTKCLVKYTMLWGMNPEYGEHEMYVNQEIPIQEFNQKAYLIGDSIYAPIYFNYKTNYEFYKEDTLKYLKCK